MKFLRLTKKTIRREFKLANFNFILSRDEVRINFIETPNSDQSLISFKFSQESNGDYVSRQPEVVKFFSKLYKKGKILVNSLSLPEENEVAEKAPRQLSDHDKQLAKSYVGNLVGPRFVQNGVKMVMTENGPMTMEQLTQTIRSASFSRIKQSLIDAAHGNDEKLSFSVMSELDAIPDGNVEEIEKLYDKVQLELNSNN